MEELYYVYIIKSTLTNWNYVGFTTDVYLRIKQHNNRQVKSTKFYTPFALIFDQIVNNNREALLEIL